MLVSDVQVELKASKLQLLGACDAGTYPLQKKKHSLEFLRTIAHLRPRTNTMGKHRAADLAECS